MKNSFELYAQTDMEYPIIWGYNDEKEFMDRIKLFMKEHKDGTYILYNGINVIGYIEKNKLKFYQKKH